MDIICRSATQVHGYGVVCRGAKIEWPDGRPFPPQVLGNFVDAKTGRRLENCGQNANAGGSECGARAVADRDELVRRTGELGRDKLVAMLDAAGIPHAANIGAEAAAEKLLRAKGEIE